MKNLPLKQVFTEICTFMRTDGKKEGPRNRGPKLCVKITASLVWGTGNIS